MKTLEEIIKIRENYESELANCGLNADNVDYDKLAVARERFEKVIESTISQTKQELIEEINKDMVLYRDGTYHINFEVWDKFSEKLSNK